MMKDHFPANESERLAAVRRYDILDTPPDGAFDRITTMAARLFKAPIAIVSIVDHDRIWFKSHHGLDVTEIGRDPGLCASAILQGEPYVLQDAKRDPRSLANPLVAGEFGLRFYAAAPLRTSDGFNLGTLCVIDKEPRLISAEDLAQLEDLASIVMDQLELRRSARASIEELAASQLRFSTVVSQASTGVVQADATGRMTLVNRRWCEMLGYTEAELLGMNIADVTDPESLESTLEAVRQMAEGGADFVIETRYRRSDGSPLWASSSVNALRGPDSEFLGLVAIVLDVGERKRAQEQQNLLLKELDHRVKNLFAVVGGVVALSARSAATPKDLADNIQGRLGALATAHRLVRPHEVESRTVSGETTLGELVTTVLAPYGDTARTGERAGVVIEGPEVWVGGDAVTAVALVLHELATNAAKYGAFSTPDGRVAITWSMDKDRLELTWRERGGPVVLGAPEHEGFGSLLARRSVQGQLGGQVTYDWDPEGLVVQLSAAQERLAL